MHLSPSAAKTSLHIIKTSLVKPSISSAPPCQANKKGLMSICTSITFTYLNNACNYLGRKMLDEMTKVCTLLWFNRKCSISALKNILRYSIIFWNKKKKRKVCGCNVAHLVPVKNFGLWVPLPPCPHPFLSDGVLLHCLQTWRNFSVERDTHAQQH